MWHMADKMNYNGKWCYISTHEKEVVIDCEIDWEDMEEFIEYLTGLKDDHFNEL
jgi:hypothetical protein